MEYVPSSESEMEEELSVEEDTVCVGASSKHFFQNWSLKRYKDISMIGFRTMRYIQGFIMGQPCNCGNSATNRGEFTNPVDPIRSPIHVEREFELQKTMRLQIPGETPPLQRTVLCETGDNESIPYWLSAPKGNCLENKALVPLIQLTLCMIFTSTRDAQS